MTTDGNMTGRAAVFTGGSFVSARCVAALAWLGALGTLIGLVVMDAVWWEKALYGFLGIPVLMVVGASLWSDAGEERADFARLRRSGRPAVAEVVGMETTTDGESEWAVLTLRITGPDVPPFEGRFRCEPEPVMRVGARLKAVVDTSDNLFTLRPV
jgi:hypothetical protein